MGDLGRREIENVAHVDCRVSSNRRHVKTVPRLYGGREYKSPSRLGLEAAESMSMIEFCTRLFVGLKKQRCPKPRRRRIEKTDLYIEGCRPTVRHRTESGQSTHRHHPCPPPLATSSKKLLCKRVIETKQNKAKA